jgi:hypothetical protein
MDVLPFLFIIIEHTRGLDDPEFASCARHRRRTDHEANDDHTNRVTKRHVAEESALVGPAPIA